MSTSWLPWFGALTNFLISLSVVLYGLAWVYRKPSAQPAEFIYRTYFYWWASWVAWVFAWLLLLLKSKLGMAAIEKVFPYPTEMQVDTVILLLDNLNTICLVLVFLALVRGVEYTARRGRIDFFRLSSSLAAAYNVLYIFMGLMTQEILVAYKVHKAWSESIGVVTPIIVGWAVYLRFNTRSLLLIGFLYGFIQPVVYATQLTSDLGPLREMFARWQPLIAMILGAMKVAWAIVFTRILSSRPWPQASLILPAPPATVRFTSGKDRSVAWHAIVLITVYLSLFVWLLIRYLSMQEVEPFISGFAVSLGVVIGMLAFLQFLWWLWDLMNRPGPPEARAGHA